MRNGNACVAAPVITAAPAASDNGDVLLYAGGGVVAALAVVSYLYPSWGGIFSFSPDYDYSFTESGYAYNAGGRVDYQADNLHLYWTATQENKDGNFGDFRYSSGAEYDGDVWAASFSESIGGKVADYDFSLSAIMNGDIWKISSVYRLHSRYEELQTGWESESENALTVEGWLTYRGWTLKPSAGFQWQNAEEFGDVAQFGLEGAFNYNHWHIRPAAAFQLKSGENFGENAEVNLEVVRRF